MGSSSARCEMSHLLIQPTVMSLAPATAGMNEIAIRRTPTDGSHFRMWTSPSTQPFGANGPPASVVYSMCRDAAMAAPLSNASAVLFPVPVILKAIALPEAQPPWPMSS